MTAKLVQMTKRALILEGGAMRGLFTAGVLDVFMSASVYRALSTRHIRYNATMDYIDALEAAGKLQVIRPSAALPIGRLCHNPAVMRKVYELGRKAVENIK